MDIKDNWPQHGIVAVLKRERDEAQRSFVAAQAAGMSWMQRAVTAEDSADALAEVLRDMLTAAQGLDFACEAIAAETLNDYEKGRPK